MPSVVAQPALLFLGCFAEHCAETHRYGKETGSLTEYEIKVFIQRDTLAQLFHLQQLAFHHLLREFDQRIENFEVPFLDGNFESLHVKPVAGEDALGISPL